MKSDDEVMALVAEARSGSGNAREARDAVMEFLRPKMRSFAARQFPDVIKPHLDPSDITQEALIRVDNGLNDFNGTTVGQLIAWAEWKVKGKISDHLQKQLADKRLGSSAEISGPTGDELLQSVPARDLSASSSVSNIETMRTNIERLPEDTRQVMSLMWLSDMSSQEIAEKLDLTIAEVDQLERRALKALRKIQESQVGDERQ